MQQAPDMALFFPLLPVPHPLRLLAHQLLNQSKPELPQTLLPRAAMELIAGRLLAARLLPAAVLVSR